MTSRKTVVTKLEKKLGVDLTEKKKMIFELVMEYVNEKDESDGAEEASEEEEEEEEVLKHFFFFHIFTLNLVKIACVEYFFHTVNDEEKCGTINS